MASAFTCGINVARIYDERFLLRYRDPHTALSMDKSQREYFFTGQWRNYRCGHRLSPDVEIIDLFPDNPMPDWSAYRHKRNVQTHPPVPAPAGSADDNGELPGQLDLATLFDSLKKPDPDSPRTPEQNREFHKIIGDIAKANDLPFDSIKALMVEKFFGHPQKTSQLTYKDMQRLIEWSYRVKAATCNNNG